MVVIVCFWICLLSCCLFKIVVLCVNLAIRNLIFLSCEVFYRVTNDDVNLN